MVAAGAQAQPAGPIDSRRPMARLSLPEMFRRKPAEGAPAPEGGPPTPARARRLPTPGALRRERRALVRTREDRIRDLGGLMLEMYRRDQFKQDLLIEQCLEVISVEERLREIDELLEASSQQRREGVGVRCTCGAPIQWGFVPQLRNCIARRRAVLRELRDARAAERERRRRERSQPGRRANDVPRSRARGGAAVGRSLGGLSGRPARASPST